MPHYKVISGGLFLAGGEAKEGDVIELEGDVSHLSSKVVLTDSPKKFEVATPQVKEKAASRTK